MLLVLSMTVDRVSLIGLLFLAVIRPISYSHFQMHQEKHRFLMLHEAVASVFCCVDQEVLFVFSSSSQVKSKHFLLLEVALLWKLKHFGVS